MPLLKQILNMLWSYCKRLMCYSLYFAVLLLYVYCLDHYVLYHNGTTLFPGNVAGMVLATVVLLCCRWKIPRYTSRFLLWIEPCASFAQRNMTVLFLPSLVNVVNSVSAETNWKDQLPRVLLILVIGYIVVFLFCTIIVRFIRWTFYFGQKRLGMSRRQSSIDGSDAVPDNVSHIVTVTPPQEVQAEAKDEKLPDPPVESEGFNVYVPIHILVLSLIFVVCALIYNLPLSDTSVVFRLAEIGLSLSMSLLAFEACKSLPAALLVWMHPLVLAAPVVIAGLSYFQAIKGRDLSTGLQRYLTEHSALPPYDGWPGAGNIMLAAMDVSIVSLSATVVSQSFAFQELCITVICAVVMVFVALFLVPLTAQGIGMTPLLSLAFTTRSVTAAIGITISRMVHSNMSIAGCIIVLTGVMGPLLGPVLLRLARVSKDDHLTIGVTMGSISHGIATAYLYNTNRPAAAMASLAFTLSAVVAVITASIPPLATAARVTAGYSP